MKLIRPFIFWVSQIALSLIALEFVAYYFLKTSANPHYRARRVLQQNEIWGWQSQSNLKSTFENEALFTDKNSFRTEAPGELIDLQQVELLTLGPSSAFGWGVSANNTYTALVAKNLQLKYLNASQIGFSTEQGRLLWEHFLNGKLPNLKYVIISYGINDLDRFRFFDLSFTDDISYFSQTKAELKPFILNSNLALTAKLFKDETTLKFNCQSLTKIMQRLSIEQSKQANINLIKSLKATQAKIILVGTPYIKMLANSQYQRSDVEKYYQQAESSALAGHCQEALSKIRDAKSLEPWRVESDVVLHSEMLKKLSAEEKVSFIDIYSAFNQLSPQKDYFVDPVHPSIKGHELMAKLILENMK